MPFQCFLTETTALAEKATGRIVYLLHPFSGAPGGIAIRSNRWPNPLHGPDVMEVFEVASESYRTARTHHQILIHGIARGPGLPAGIEDGDQFFLYPSEEIPGRQAMPITGFSIKGLNLRSGDIDLIPIKYLLLNPQAKAIADFQYLSCTLPHQEYPRCLPIPPSPAYSPYASTASSASSTSVVGDTFTLCGAIKQITWSPPSSRGPATDDPIVFGINHRTMSSGYMRLHWLSALTVSDIRTWREQNMPVHHFTPPATSSVELSMTNLAMTGPLLPPPVIDHDFDFESCAARDCRDHYWEIQCNGAHQLMEERRVVSQASNAWSGSNVGDQEEMLKAFADTIGWE